MSKIAVITGSSGGIGSALVRTYLNDGYFVIGLDRRASGLATLESYTEMDVNLILFAKDAFYRKRILKDIKDLFPKILTKLVVVNNAAEQILKAVSEIEWSDWEASIAVNAIAPFYLATGLVLHLENANGHVVNISSIHAKLTKPRFACYATSKAALESVTRSLALELSPLGISVNAIAPAAIMTDMLKAGFQGAPEKLGELEAYHPSNSIGTPKQLSALIKSITDQEGGFLTGSVLGFNGGIGGCLHDPD